MVPTLAEQNPSSASKTFRQSGRRSPLGPALVVIMLASTWTGLVIGADPVAAQAAGVTVPGLLGEFFHDNNLTERAFERIDPTLNFDWGQEAPDSRLDPDTFSVRWTGYLTAPTTGHYDLAVNADDKVRLHLNDVLLIDEWAECFCDWRSATVELQAGVANPIRIEHSEEFGFAKFLLNWGTPEAEWRPVPASALSTDAGLLATYHADQTLTDPVATRLEPLIDHDWGSLAPDAPVGEDSFSVRWTGTVTAPTTGGYTFYTRSDDGARVKIANHTVLDDWNVHAATADHPSQTVHLTAGVPAQIVVEYFEATGGASMQLKWSGSGVPLQIVPTSALRPALEAVLPTGIPPAIDGRESVLADAAQLWGGEVSYRMPQATAPVACSPASGSGFAVGTTPVTCTATDAAGNQATTQFVVQVEPMHGLLGEYFHNDDWTGPAFERIDRGFNFDWRLHAPDPRLDRDTFSVRWSGAVTAPTTGQYTFYANTSGELRLFIDNIMVIRTTCCVEASASLPMTAGIATPIRVEYAEDSGEARTELQWSATGIAKQPVPTSAFSTEAGLLATYYDDTSLSQPFRRGVDPSIDYNWSTNGPSGARWTGFITAPATGEYTFYTRSDDGARVWIAGDLVIDDWYLGEADHDEPSSPVHLVRGVPTRIQVDHFQESAGAVMQLKWSGPDTPRQVVPTTALSPALGVGEAASAVEVETGGYITCALIDTGNIDCWAANWDNRIAAGYVGGDAIDVAAGGAHVCALLETGNIHCFGDNAFGQAAAYTDGDATGVTAGVYHTCALLEGGNVDCWGNNDFGQAADYEGGDAVLVAAGDDHTCAVRETGNIDCWGKNEYGQAADYQGGDAIQVTGGSFHTCALLEAGNVHCWGDDWHAQAAPIAGDATRVTAGWTHTCALLEAGNIACWGSNWYGQVADYTGGDATSVTAGVLHTCALFEGGRIDCWGNNWYGQLDAPVQTVPPRIDPHETVVAEATGPDGAAVDYTVPFADHPATCTPGPGNAYAVGTHQVTCTTSDPWGNVARTFFAIRVLPDITAPTTTIEIIGTQGDNGWYISPVNVTLACEDTGWGCDRTYYTLGDIIHRGDGLTVFQQGITTLQDFYSIDGRGNREEPKTQAVKVDTEPPVIETHENETYEATGPNGTNVSYAPPRWTDAAVGDGNATCTPAAGTGFPLGDTTVTCSARDPAGHQAAATTFVVSVVDTTPPVIAAHPDAVLEATAYGGATVNYTTPTWHDLVDGNGTAACAPASGTFQPMGTTTVTCSATDSAGNTANATTFNVTIVPGPVATVAVSHDNRTVNLAQPVAFSATGFDRYGNPTGDAPAWTAENGTIDANGTYVGSAVGSWKINATIQNITSGVVVNVTDQLRLDVQMDAQQYHPVGALGKGVWGTVNVTFWDETPLANATIEILVTRTPGGIDLDTATMTVTSAPDGTARFRVPDTYAVIGGYRVDAAVAWNGNTGQAATTYAVL